MTTIEDKWAITAYHEIGHFAGYCHFGVRFGSIRLYEKDGQVVGAVTSPAGTYNVMERAVICLSGPCSEERFTGIPVSEQSGAYTDLLMCKDALAKLDIGPPLTVESLIPFTRLMIEHNFPTIQALATQLLISNELAYEDVLALFR
jgi:hypothetical protein